MSTCRRQGFTLFEMAMVLAIIGLLAGGTLVGKDLILAAEIHATVSQIGKYNTAFKTFEAKYGGMPGDLAFYQAAAFGLFTFSGPNAGMPGYGDGDGIIQSTESTFPSQKTKASGENIVFWRHLSEAQLIDGVYGMIGDAAINPVTGAVSAALFDAEIGGLLPQAKLGAGSFFPVYSVGAQPYFEIHALHTVEINGWYNTRSIQLVQPTDAVQLDRKMDDSMPNTGTVLARGQTDPAYGGLNQLPNNAPAVQCVTGFGVSDRYRDSNAQRTCAIRVRFQ